MVKHILIVEDSRTQAIRLKLELERYDVEVNIATTGTAGLRAARTQIPDAIVLDVELPEMNGFSVCQAVKADPRTAHVPVVMLTRRDLAADALEGLEVGADDYIPKDTFAEQNLIEALRHLGLL